jgi:predicted MPP superfamily phosphohydrolase
MRILPILITFVIMAFLPSAVYLRYSLKQKNEITSGVIAMFALPTLSLLAFILLAFATRLGYNIKIITWIIWAMLLTMLPQNIYAIFYLINDIIYIFAKRSYKWLHYAGAISAIIIAFCMIIGMANRHNLKVREVTIYSKNLPKEFDGMRIAHITDLHLGNLSPRDNYLKKIVTKLTEIRPDMLVFTGDMMNISAEEVEGLDGLFDTIDAPYGRYAVMGNHDYGDYKKWESEEAKEANLMAAYEAYRRVGFVLLNDSVAKLTWEHFSPSSDSCSISIINIIGVENCGKPPFPHYGDLAEATERIEPAQFYLPQCYNSLAEPAQFNILLSHDPTHWREEVVKEEYKYIDLTLSGHTHSAQIGINLGKFKWSPSQWIFDEWDGLYQEGNQYLYVSRGLGYVGIPFRLGMPAEISIIKLKSKE